ncbi:MAG: magnesium transporter [candidate division WOR-3 bacterium]
MAKRRSNGILKNLLKPEIEELIYQKDWQALKAVLESWHPQDIADLLEELPEADSALLFFLLPPQLQIEVFEVLESDAQLNLIRKIGDEKVKSLITDIAPDARVKLFEKLPPQIIQKLSSLLSPKDFKETLTLLGFPENSVGRLMTPEYIAVKPDWTVKKALEHIRAVGLEAETINMIYVIDDTGKLLDDIPLRRLILADPKQTIQEIMDKSFIAIRAYEDQEEAAKLMKRYDLIAMPVLDDNGILLGIVTIDDIVDVLEEEQTEDITKISAIGPKVDADIITRLKEIPIKKFYKSRISWLILLLVMDLITGSIIQGFEQTIAKYVVLVTFLPVLVDTAGNAGSQSATLVIRALALGTVQMRDWLYLLGKEIMIGGLLGLTMGAGISIMGFVRGRRFQIALVVITAMVINVIIGCAIGVLLPFIFKKLKKDPATASAPLVTTLADILGTAIYLGMAYLFLR